MCEQQVQSRKRCFHIHGEKTSQHYSKSQRFRLRKQDDDQRFSENPELRKISGHDNQVHQFHQNSKKLQRSRRSQNDEPKQKIQRRIQYRKQQTHRTQKCKI